MPNYAGVLQRINGSARIVADGSVGIALLYKGNQASATYTVDATGITLKHGAAGAEAADSTVGASGVVADATYTTLGAMVDAINLSPNWRAEIVDALRADTSANTLKAVSETTISSPRKTVVPLYIDSSVALHLSYRISARRTNFNRRQKRSQSILRQARALVNVGSGTLLLRVYEMTPNSDTATLLAEFTGADNTELVAPTGAFDAYIRSNTNRDLLIRYITSVDLPDSGAYLDVAGLIES